MNYEDTVLILDLDGTLLSLDEDRNSYISTKNLEAIDAFVKGGGTFSIATGRSYERTIDLVKELPLNFPLSMVNGAMSVHEEDFNQRLRHIPLRASFVDKLIAFFKAHQDSALILVDEHRVYGIDGNIKAVSHFGYEWEIIDVNGLPEGDIYKVGFMVDSKDTEAFYNQLKPLFEGENVTVIKAMRGYIELFSETATKGDAVRDLMQERNIEAKTFICAGDQMNDFSMLKKADYGLVPSNGNPKLKKEFIPLNTHHNDSIMPEILSFIKKI